MLKDICSWVDVDFTLLIIAIVGMLLNVKVHICSWVDVDVDAPYYGYCRYANVAIGLFDSAPADPTGDFNVQM